MLEQPSQNHMGVDEQVRYLMQGTEYGDLTLKENMAAELRERLIEAEREQRPLRVYCGFDPRKSDLHIGHTVPMGKLREFQDLGHKVTFLVGTFTSLIGDPSDKEERRAIMTGEEVRENARTYAEQACRILDHDKTEIRYNHEWLSDLSITDMIGLASHFTIQQFLNRDNFRRRWDRGEAIFLQETFYALMQAYDAVTLKADVQVGGSDQLFNIMTASRKLMSALGQRPNIAVIMGILPGTDGEVKMSKSLGNHIPILAGPEDMYGKVMSIPDKAISAYLTMATHLTPGEIDEIMGGMKSGALHPRDAKMRLAREIVAIHHSKDEAVRAEEAFRRVFQRSELPEDMPVYRIRHEESLLDILTRRGLAASRSEGRRLVEQRGVRLDGQVLTDAAALIKGPGVLQVGKRRFLRLE